VRYTIEFYETSNKKRPVELWLEKKERFVVHAVTSRLRRVSSGNFGECRFLREEVSEIKFNLGPGYRIYYSVIGQKIVLLLSAGDKSGQSRDIEKAVEYLKDYKNRGRSHAKK
jgi:putative addiction module killer protein